MSTQESRLEIVVDSSKASNNLSKLRVALKQIEDAANHTSSGVDKIDRSLSKMGEAAKYYKDALSRVAVVASSFFAGQQLLRAAEAWTNINNRLKLVTESSEEAARAQRAILDIAKSTHQPLQATADLYTRIAKNQKALNLTSKELASVTKTVAQSMVISGASAQAGEAALIQLGQALGSGVLRGDELNSIMEQAQGLADTIAKGMGVSIGELRKLGAEGKLTAQAVIEAIKSQEEAVNQAFSGMQVTVSQATNDLNTALIEWVGNADQSSGTSRALAGAIEFLADNFDDVAKTIATTTAAWATYRLTTAALSPATLALAKDALSAAKAMIGLRVATEGVTKAQMLLRLTPLGLAAGAAALAFSTLTERQDENANSLDNLAPKVDQIISKLSTMNRVQLENALVDLNENKQAKYTAFLESFDKLWRNAGAASAGYADDIRKALWSVATDWSLSADQVLQKQVEVIQEFEKSGGAIAGASERARVFIRDVATAAEEFRKSKEYIDQTKQSIESLNSKITPPKGMEKWDEYLKKLTDARDVVGLTTRELAKYKAEQEGANALQAETAGIVSAQEQAYKDLEQAIRDKDARAVKAAKDNIKQLDIEQQKVALLAEQMATIMLVAENFRKQGVSADIQAGIYRSINEYYGKQQIDLANGKGEQSKESKSQVSRIELATVSSLHKKRSGGGGGGGGRASESELQSLTKSLKEQIAVFGMTDAEAQKYKISLMQGTEAEKAYAATLVDKISKRKEEMETLKQSRLMADELRVFEEKEMLELTTMGMGDRAREQLEREYQIRMDFAQRRRQLEEEQESENTRISSEAFNARLEALRQNEEAQLNIIREKGEAKREEESNLWKGLAEGLNNYANEARNVYAQMAQYSQSWAQQSTDALVDFVMTGKANFKDLANSIIRDLMRIFIQQQITGLFANVIGGLFSGGAFSGIGNVGHSFTVGGSAPTGLTSIGPKITLATGGLITGPGTGTSDSIPAMLSNGEYVINAEATRKNYALLEAINSGRLPQYRASGGVVGNPPTVAGGFNRSAGNSVTVNITNKGGQPVTGNAQVSMDSMGNMVVDVMLEDLNKNGRYTQQLKSMMGR